MPTTTPPRRPRIEGDREAEVLDAAVAVLAEVGYDRLTMDQVALTARASKATLYRRWSSKAELVVDAVSRTRVCPTRAHPTPGRCAATCWRWPGDRTARRRSSRCRCSLVC